MHAVPSRSMNRCGILAVAAVLVAGGCAAKTPAAAPATTTSTTSTSTTVAPATTEAPTSTTRALSKSEALCADLRSGLTPLQIYGAVRGDYENPRDFADKAFGMVATSCPELLKSNEALRVWLGNWGIDPDA